MVVYGKERVMKNTVLLSIFALSLLACQQGKPHNNSSAPSEEQLENYVDSTHTAQNVLDWAGTYTGTTPCADCPGIKINLKINRDQTFVLKSIYLERQDTLDQKGTFKWLNNGSTIQLEAEDLNTQFKVGEDQLLQLDQAGNEINGALANLYILKKQK